MDTWMVKMFHIGQQSAVLQRLNKLVRMVGGLGGSDSGEEINPVTKPTLTPLEFSERIDRLIQRVEEGQGECSKTAQLLQ